MNKSAFLELIQQASAISDQQTEELEKVAATFPYCQTAHLLLAKSAHDKGSMLSTQRLRRASAYATNRQVLKRLIYTSPAPAPVFEEPVTEEPVTAAPETLADTTVLLSAAHQEKPANIAVSEEAIYGEKAVEELPDTESQEAAATISKTKLPNAAEQIEAGTEDNSLHIAHKHPAAAGTAENMQEPEEGTYFELAHLLTINSLSPSFTDLLAQKADPETPEMAASEAAEETITDFPDQDADEDGASAQLTIAENTTAPHNRYVPEDASSPAAEQGSVPDQEADGTLYTAPAASPESAEISYSFSEIDQMYVDDVLGYWMASSRMGETLQLKDEVTRQRPVAFHPELILEYTKTHVLEEKPQEQQAASLHHQYSIIDQFLKLNPRLNSMQHIKMKQEPQEDLSLRNSKIKKGIASESLANIFLNQGKVKKAIKIYEQLLLKYPEKKSYFAGQIEKLQNLS